MSNGVHRSLAFCTTIQPAWRCSWTTSSCASRHCESWVSTATRFPHCSFVRATLVHRCAGRRCRCWCYCWCCIRLCSCRLQFRRACCPLRIKSRLLLRRTQRAGDSFPSSRGILSHCRLLEILRPVRLFLFHQRLVFCCRPGLPHTRLWCRCHLPASLLVRHTACLIQDAPTH